MHFERRLMALNQNDYVLIYLLLCLFGYLGGAGGFEAVKHKHCKHVLPKPHEVRNPSTEIPHIVHFFLLLDTV